jgi:hypothetical protein
VDARASMFRISGVYNFKLFKYSRN